MPRNRSEKPPHIEMPISFQKVTERFQERARLWAVYSHNPSTRNEDAYNDYCNTFSALELSAYGSLPIAVTRRMAAYYAMMARKADRAA